MPDTMPPWNPKTMIAAPRVFLPGAAIARMYDCTPMNSMPWPTPDVARASVTSQKSMGKARASRPRAASISPP